MLYNKWWGKDSDSGAKTCPKHVSDMTKASALNLINIGGVFVVLLGGLCVAIAVMDLIRGESLLLHYNLHTIHAFILLRLLC